MTIGIISLLDGYNWFSRTQLLGVKGMGQVKQWIQRTHTMICAGSHVLEKNCIF